MEESKIKDDKINVTKSMENLNEDMYPEITNVEYKHSRYNFFFEIDNGDVLAFNAVTGGLLKISKERFSVIKKILENPIKLRLSKDQDFHSVFKILIKGGFLGAYELKRD